MPTIKKSPKDLAFSRRSTCPTWNKSNPPCSDKHRDRGKKKAQTGNIDDFVGWFGLLAFRELDDFLGSGQEGADTRVRADSRVVLEKSTSATGVGRKRTWLA